MRPRWRGPCAREGRRIMKIVSFEASGELRLGVVEGDQVVDLKQADAKAPSDLGDWLAGNSGDLRRWADWAKRAPASARKPLAGLRYALPIPRPGKVICLGLNYLKHLKEGRYANDPLPQYPTLFMRGLNSLVPHLQPLIRPRL